MLYYCLTIFNYKEKQYERTRKIKTTVFKLYSAGKKGREKGAMMKGDLFLFQINKNSPNNVMLTSENIVVLRASIRSASKLLIFVTSHRKRIINPFSRSTTNFA